MLSLISEFWAFAKERKKIWLFPLVLILLIIGGVLVWSSGSIMAPFIYALF